MPGLKKKEYIAGGLVNLAGNALKSSKNPMLQNLGNVASTVSRFTPAGRIAQKGYDVASSFIPALQNNQVNPQGDGPLAGLSNMANKANNMMGALGPLAKMLAKNGMAIPNAEYLPRYESGVKMMKGGSVNMPQGFATTPYGYGGYVKAEDGMKNPDVKDLLDMLNQMPSERPNAGPSAMDPTSEGGLAPANYRKLKANIDYLKNQLESATDERQKMDIQKRLDNSLKLMNYMQGSPGE